MIIKKKIIFLSILSLLIINNIFNINTQNNNSNELLGDAYAFPLKTGEIINNINSIEDWNLKNKTIHKLDKNSFSFCIYSQGETSAAFIILKNKSNNNYILTGGYVYYFGGNGVDIFIKKIYTINDKFFIIINSKGWTKGYYITPGDENSYIEPKSYEANDILVFDNLALKIAFDPDEFLNNILKNNSDIIIEITDYAITNLNNKIKLIINVTYNIDEKKQYTYLFNSNSGIFKQ